MMQRQAARVSDDDGELAAVFSSSSPFFRNRRTFFLLCLVNRLKIVLTLTFYPFFPANFNVFSIFPLDAGVYKLSKTPMLSILTSQGFRSNTPRPQSRKPPLVRDQNDVEKKPNHSPQKRRPKSETAQILPGSRLNDVEKTPSRPTFPKKRKKSEKTQTLPASRERR